MIEIYAGKRSGGKTLEMKINKFYEDIHNVGPIKYLDFTYTLSKKKYKILANFMIKKVVPPEHLETFMCIIEYFYKYIGDNNESRNY